MKNVVRNSCIRSNCIRRLLNEALAINETPKQHSSRKLFTMIVPPVSLTFVSWPKGRDFDERIDFTRGFNRGRGSTFSRVVEERTTSRGRERRACEGVVSFNPPTRTLYVHVTCTSRNTGHPLSTGCRRCIHLFLSHNPFLLQTFLLVFTFSRYFLWFREDSVVCESFRSDIHVFFFILPLKSDILKNFNECRITASL